jgi:hypothetical protein
MGWQKAVGYGRRSLGETAMFRYKAIIGRGGAVAEVVESGGGVVSGLFNEP